jgi:phosphatidylglycerophosphate synthase
VTAAPPEPAGLAFKAYEIEEFVDVHFFRRAGIFVARAARSLRLTPNAVSVIAAAVGIAGGAMLASDRLALAGFALLIVHGVIDSADGQLARMTGQVSEFGRVLDGVSGYVTHTAAYAAVLIGVLSRGGSPWLAGLAVFAGLCTAMQAQMYDYHRTVYAAVVIKGQVTAPAARPRHRHGVVAAYEAMQHILAGAHRQVEAVIAGRARLGEVREVDRARYRQEFYGPVCGWNLLGDNVRRYAIGLLAVTHRLDLLFLFIVGPMNLVFLVLWLRQQRVDRRFLTWISSTVTGSR